MRRRQLVVPALVAALVLGLSGCGADSPKPGPVAESSGTSSKSSVVPTLPADASGGTSEAGAAYIRYYFDMLSFAASTGDTAGLQRLAISDCESCVGVAGRIKQIYRAGGHIEGGGTKVVSIRYQQPKDRYRVQLRVARQKTFARAGAEPTLQQPLSFEALFYVSRTGNEWAITDWTRV